MTVQTQPTQPVMAVLTVPRHMLESGAAWPYEQIEKILANPGIDQARLFIGGYDDDPRELWEIPEYVQFARALVARQWPLAKKFAEDDLAVLAKAVCDAQRIKGGVSVNSAKWQAVWQLWELPGR